MEMPGSYEMIMIEKYRREIWDRLRKAVSDYELISEGDRIAVCISGGKDSMLLALCMKRLMRYSKVRFQCRFLAMDPGYSEENRQRIIDNAQKLGIDLEICDTNIFSSVGREEKNPCFLCARLRRGFLYKKAKELGCNKIALGHHFDDMIETIVMGMLYGSQMQTMMPKLHSENVKGMEVIRPLYLVREESVISWAEECELAFIRCACSVSEKREDGSKRAKVKALLGELRASDPAVDMNIFRSVQNVNLRTLISYHDGDEYHSFLDDYDKGISVRGRTSADYGEDKADR